MYVEISQLSRLEVYVCLLSAYCQCCRLVTVEYFETTIILLSLTTVMTVFILDAHHRGSVRAPPPKWVQWFFLNIMARALCMHEVVNTNYYQEKVSPVGHTSVAFCALLISRQ